MRRGSDGSASDESLVAAVKLGDRDALEELLRRHHERIHLLCRRMCADRGDAEDATQDALIAIVRGLAAFDGRARFTTWSYRVASNACVDQLRRRARRPMPAEWVADEPDVMVDDGSRITDAHSPNADDPAERALQADQRGRLTAALAQLPESFRLPVVLRDVADLDYAEIAALLDLPPGTVRSRISRGRTRLAELLEDLAPGNPAEPSIVREGEQP